MKIGVWMPHKEVLSVSIYKKNICQYLQEQGHILVYISPDFSSLPELDILWDATCTGGKSPSYKLLCKDIPIVVTLHGAANYILPKALQIHQAGLRKSWLLYKQKLLWKFYAKKVRAVITVSEYAKSEILQIFPISASKVLPIYHGYDPNLFFYDNNIRKNIWLHVSAYQPKKNVDRIIEAYAKIEDSKKPKLVIVSKGYTLKNPLPQGITLYAEGRDASQLATLYKQAATFIFPSIHETFGLPLIEAMASGCAIITSNTSSCIEIVGDAGICVEPYDTDTISLAMTRLLNQEEVDAFRRKSLARAKDFSWQKCAEEHEQLMRSVVKNTS
jgi:glycosyltransferase involved in cell wall biosynthesis